MTLLQMLGDSIRRRVSLTNGLILLLGCIAQICWSQDIPSEKLQSNRLSKNTAGLTWQVLNINNLWTWHRSDGEGNHSPRGEDGLSYPVFTARCVYEDNLIFGGIMYVNGFPESSGTRASYQSIRVNGGIYLSSHGLVQGWVDGQGAGATPHDPNDPAVRIYRVRRDYKEMSRKDLMRDAAIVHELPSVADATEMMIEAIKSQYEQDWLEWPVQHGAPYIDRNGNGVYDPPPSLRDDGSFTADGLVAGNYDEPGIAAGSGSSPADQVMYTVYHSLDKTKSHLLADSDPMGIEVQKTVWGYKNGKGLDDHYFTRYRMINKGGIDTSGGQFGAFSIDSLFVGQWADIDLGNYGDDLLGCDTLLNLAFVYNSRETDNLYSRFNLTPPSVGYTLLAGPLVSGSPSDSGISDFRRILGHKNLGMSSFVYFGSGDPFGEPISDDYDRATGRWWAMLRGFAPVGTIHDPPYSFPRPPGFPPTLFPYSGDPVARTGWIDGLGTVYSLAPGDRRIFVNTGPIRLAPGDTADIVFSTVVGLGADRLSSITLMKANAQASKKLNANLFGLPHPPLKPIFNAVELNNAIVLEWGGVAQRVAQTERAVIADEYTFEGYNLYQLPTLNSGLDEGKKIATFDIVNGITSITRREFDLAVGQFQPVLLQRGSDSGLQRYARITKDHLLDGAALNNGTEYYFALTAYNYSPLSTTAPSLESSPIIVKAKPRIPFGISLPTSFGDTISISHTSGSSSGSVVPIVIDPTAGTGDTYELRFDASAAPITWSVINVTQGTTVMSDQTNQSGDEDYLIAEGGVLVKVIDNPTQPNSSSDTFRYTVPGTSQNKAAVRASIKRMSVFPNPSVAGQSDGSRSNIVTFTNLPPKATIRIYNLAGQLIRTLRKDNPSQFLQWNLTNEQNWQVASGIYLCHIEMPEIGESKVVKLAVVQSQLFGPY